MGLNCGRAEFTDCCSSHEGSQIRHKVSTDSIEKKFAAIETKLGIIEAAVKELSTIVKSTHTFSIQGSVYEVQ